ncbi:sulfotransferase family protein [Albidovulum sediminis]|uniref:Sulfotransferase family protein n=1 Tax=Albidovulum sediminis TaxID=3066345 RepID=A0ABT2NIY2_9RHOB|nr:sulfotransferase family protein [Defluviimonas sediminis]MCT8328878.1 hypothetical protein [Defluviimonas sediminis]
MTLKIIGSGFGRSGTKSLKLALESLGFGPCHHMHEVIASERQQALWMAAMSGAEIDWGDIYAGFSRQVDWPGLHYWHEASVAFPAARVIHTERDEEDWWASFSTTIGRFHTVLDQVPLPPALDAFFRALRTTMVDPAFGDHTDKASAIAAYRAHNARVRATIPAGRLLVMDVRQGWGPLCDFLGTDVPDAPFPRTNARAEFRDVVAGEPGPIEAD